jgi:hypothetical protein
MTNLVSIPLSREELIYFKATVRGFLTQISQSINRDNQLQLINLLFMYILDQNHILSAKNECNQLIFLNMIMLLKDKLNQFISDGISSNYRESFQSYLQTLDRFILQSV